MTVVSASAWNAFEQRVLVLEAAAREDVEHRVVALRPLDLAAGGAQLELREMRACGKPGEIARAQHQLAVKQLHGVHPLRRPPRGDASLSHPFGTCRYKRG